jgi:hypothetical protein
LPLDGPPLRRDKQLATRADSKLTKKLLETFDKVREGFEKQGKRADAILDYWDCYDCALNQHQFYNGNAAMYVPIIRNAVQARVTRFLNQIFPSSGRYIDATATDEGVPHAIVAILEHYIRRARFRTAVVRALLRNGDIEGQYNLYCDWNSITRHVVSREVVPPKVTAPGLPVPVEMEDEEVEAIISEEIKDAGPAFEVLHDSDVLVLPVTADSIDSALQQGGSVTVLRRWTKDTVKGMIDRGEVVRTAAEPLLDAANDEHSVKSAAKAHLDAAGIKSGGKSILVYETWVCLDTPEGRRLCKTLYGGQQLVLSATRNPFWNDRCPLLSAPVEKVSGAFKGQSPVAAVDTIQYHANDIANQAADSATYSMLPIIMTDPAKNPRTATMILNLAAIWECDPQSTQFAEFPKLWQDGIALIQADTQTIFQTLGVNPAMLPQQTGKPGAKRNQAEIALEQSVDLLTTAEACSVVEESILTPAAEIMLDLDQQYRTDHLTVRMFGELGVTARLERIPPLQRRARINLTWFGVEQAKNAAQMQQQIALLNVARGMQQPLQQAGYMLNPAPALEHAFGNLFGWRLGRQILIDARAQLTIGAETENQMLLEGFNLVVHPLDPDAQHLQAHMAALRQSGDPHGTIRLHVALHLDQMKKKSAAAHMAQMQAMMPQQPGPGGPPPNGPSPPQGTPPGAQPAPPRMMKGPPGMIPPETMPAMGAAIMPRKM